MENLLAKVNIGEELKINEHTGISYAQQFSSPGALISIILKNVYTIAGILLLFLLIFGGVSIIMSAGGGDAKKAAQGKKSVTSAIIGFLIIFASYWIIQLIEYVTGLNILNPTI